MTLLAFDTASDACSVALWRDGLAARRHAVIGRGHAEILMPMVNAALSEAGARFDSLDAVACAVGPGSFTGIRTGLAAARGLALALSIPGIGVSSLAAAAASAYAVLPRDPARTLVVALETRRADLYVQMFDDALAPLSPPAALAPGDVAGRVPPGPLAIAGDAAARLLGALAGRRPAPLHVAEVAIGDAVAVARLAAESAGAHLPLRPLYLHPPQATPAPDGGRVRP